jgi:hypothetical protein
MIIGSVGFRAPRLRQTWRRRSPPKPAFYSISLCGSRSSIPKLWNDFLLLECRRHDRSQPTAELWETQRTMLKKLRRSGTLFSWRKTRCRRSRIPFATPRGIFRPSLIANSHRCAVGYFLLSLRDFKQRGIRPLTKFRYWCHLNSETVPSNLILAIRRGRLFHIGRASECSMSVAVFDFLLDAQFNLL